MRTLTSAFVLILQQDSSMMIRLRSLVILTFFFQLLISAHGQSLDLPGERFPCDVTYCPRWGYYTCYTADGSSNCLPCDHDQLQGLCGTKLELNGCNLYCRDLALQEPKKELIETKRRLQKTEQNLTTAFQVLREFQENLTTINKELRQKDDSLTDVIRMKEQLQQNLTAMVAMVRQRERNLTVVEARLQQQGQDWKRLREMESLLEQTNRSLQQAEQEAGLCRITEKESHNKIYSLESDVTTNTKAVITLAVVVVVLLLIVAICTVEQWRQKSKGCLKQDRSTRPLLTGSDKSTPFSGVQAVPDRDEKCGGEDEKLCPGKQMLQNINPTAPNGEEDTKAQYVYN